jgi:hypothetical protein
MILSIVTTDFRRKRLPTPFGFVCGFQLTSSGLENSRGSEVLIFPRRRKLSLKIPGSGQIFPEPPHLVTQPFVRNKSAGTGTTLAFMKRPEAILDVPASFLPMEMLMHSQ